MPRSTKHKSHKQSKHSSKEGKDYSDSDEDVKMKEKSIKDESLARVSRDSGHSASGEKRKLSSQLKEGKDGKDLSGYGNGDASEEHVSSKRRKEKAEASGGTDRCNGAAANERSEMKGESLKVDVEKGSKPKEAKSLGDSKSKSSKRHESGGDKKEESTAALVEKEESKSGRPESKRKSEKDSARKEGKDSKEVKEKERGSDREKKGQESKRDANGDNVKKQGSQSGDLIGEKQGKRGRENAECSIQNEVHILELDKETEKRTRKKREGSGDRDKYEDDLNESDDKRLSSRSARTKDERNRDEKHKDGSGGDKYQDDGDRDERHKDDRYREDVDKDRKRRNDKYREQSDRDSRRRDDKYRADVDRDNRRRDDKYLDDGGGDNRRKDSKYREDTERDSGRRDDKYREDGDRDNRNRDDKYREDGDKDGRRNEDGYREDGERNDRQRDNKYREGNERDNRRKDEKFREDFERDGRRKDGKQADENDKERRTKDAKFRDERAPRDHSGNRSDAKYSRDEGHASDFPSRKSGMHDRSPGYDDHIRYRDELGRRTDDKEDLGDIRSRSTKEQRSDAEKRSTSRARVESVTERGMSTSRNADVDFSQSNSRRLSSPSAGPHTARDSYRVSKQEESKYMDYPYEERVRHGVTSRDYAGSGGSMEKITSSRSTERLLPKDDSFHGESFAERRLKLDVRSSPMLMMDKSPSSASNERRHLSRSDVRRSLDVEESTQRSGGSRDVKEGRGNRDFAGEGRAGDEPQVDGDNVSISSPFMRGSHSSVGSKSIFPPPPPFRSGADSPLMFGFSEDDSRGKSNNRHRRMNDPSMGRMQGNSWKGVPSWPSPVANGFMPFQHGPPPVGFHPVMHQFPGPPMFGVRPSMDLSHPGVPYHMPDADRFSGHGRLMGWRTPMDDSCGPPLHGWDASNGVFGEEAHLYGRPDWDQARTLSNNGRSWETSGDVWKGPIRGTSVELQTGSQKDGSIHGPGDDSFAAQLAQVQNEQKQTDADAVSNDISQPSTVPGKNTPEDLKINPEEKPIEVKPCRNEEARLCHFYLSKLDISADLTEPELFDQYTSLMGVDQKVTSDADNSKVLFLEGVVGANVTALSSFSSATLFAAVTDSVFQRAISLYKKGRDEIELIKGEKWSFSGQQGESPPPVNLENMSPKYGKVEEPAVAGDEGMHLPVSSEEVIGLSQSTCHEVCEPMVLDMIEKSEIPPSIVERVSIEGDTVLDVAQEHIVGEHSSSVEKVGGSDALEQEVSENLMSGGSPNDVKEVEKVVKSIPNDVKEVEQLLEPIPNDVKGVEKLLEPIPNDVKEVEKLIEPIPNDVNEVEKLLEPIANVSAEAFEAVMPESVESGSVNLSRIHHSPESTH